MTKEQAKEVIEVTYKDRPIDKAVLSEIIDIIIMLEIIDMIIKPSRSVGIVHPKEQAKKMIETVYKDKPVDEPIDRAVLFGIIDTIIDMIDGPTIQRSISDTIISQQHLE